MAVHRNRGLNARNISQKIWLSSLEVQAIKARAGDIPVATWLRDLALGQPSKPQVPKRNRVSQHAELIAPLTVAVARFGNNLNQIARRVNSQARQGKSVDLVRVYYELAQLRKELCRACESVSPRERSGQLGPGAD